MKSIVECVPNFSEGRRPEVIEAIEEAINGAGGVIILDREMDRDHNRSVITFVGPIEKVGEAAVRAVTKAAELIDLTRHQGEHPRMGATDVVPFIPVRNATMEDCVRIAEATGLEIWKRCKVPVYLYERAATRPDRQNLAKIRKGQFEGLREEVRTNPDKLPDFGEAELHPTAGITAVGARKFLIAYNINLDTSDVEIATKIARSVRFIGGGLRYVKGMGVLLAERRVAQVSMNLTDFESTPVHRVFNMVKSEAERYGCRIIGSEIIGLIPQKAVEMTAEFFLRVENFSPDMILENRLNKALAEGGGEGLAGEISGFLDKVASGDAVPGGGSVAALGVALGASLGSMVVALTRGRKKYQEHEKKLAAPEARLAALARDAAQGVDEDAGAYARVMTAFKMPKENEEEKAARNKAIQEATIHAARVPMGTAEMGMEVIRVLKSLEGITNPNAASDLTTGRAMAAGGVRGALANVRVNLDGIKDADIVRDLSARAGKIEEALTLGGVKDEG